MAPCFFGLLALGLLLLWLSWRGHARSGLPQGRVIYTDMGGWNRPEHPLFSREFLLTGKPDYLVDDGDDVIPVEVKSCRAPRSGHAQPYPSHILQLAAYCLLVEECYRQRPPYGIIKYADRAFEIDYTEDLRDDLLATLDDMRDDLDNDDAPRNHDEPTRCQSCGYSQHCEQHLI